MRGKCEYYVYIILPFVEYKNNAGAKPPQEDINMLYNHLSSNDQGTDSYDSYKKGMMSLF